MPLTLRRRLFLTLAPLVALLGLLGGTACLLLSRLGDRIDAILRENYDSVLFMKDLNEALERIDSSFQFALAGKEADARRQYQANWPRFDLPLAREQANITLEGEDVLVARLTELSREYRRRGDQFFATSDPAVWQRLYFGEPGKPGLLTAFETIKTVAGEILRINHANIEQASREAKATAQNSLTWFAVILAVAAALAVFLATRTAGVILQPLQAVTHSAQAIGAGQLDQVVPVLSADELGQLAEAFNTMARQLREFRQSQRARLSRVQRAAQALIDAFPDPVLVVDGAGLVEMANPAARRVLALPAGEGGTAPATPWRPPDALARPLAEALGHQQAYLPERFDQTVAFRVGDQEHSYLPRLLPIRDAGQGVGAALILEDVTRFRLLDEVKTNLVATVSHELKTPLTGIRLALHLLVEEAIGPLNPKQLELALDARDHAERMLAVVENLLDLARLQEGPRQMAARPEAVADLLQAAAEAVRPRAHDKGIAVEVAVPADLPPVRADAGQLGHALNNLLDNALTYTEPGGRVTLGAAAVDGQVTLTVQDTGRGIPAEYLPHVFERFFRVPGQSAEGGTGLGLAIVREIVTAHGGTVTCESQPGAGTTFQLTLPLAR
jgi:signal transduction histidine kinase